MQKRRKDRDDSSLKRVFLKLDLKPATLQSLKNVHRNFNVEFYLHNLYFAITVLTTYTFLSYN
jgi:hypothetical protein